MEEDDDDNLSVTWTEISEPQSEYGLEKILAERQIDGERSYLVKWEGYPDERSTWEPEDSFNLVSLELWREEYNHNLFGDDVAAEEVEEKVRKYEDAKAERHRRRERKRAKLGLPIHPGTTTSNEGDAGDDEDEEENPLQTPRPRKAAKEKPSTTKAQKPADSSPLSRPSSTVKRKEQKQRGTSPRNDKSIPSKTTEQQKPAKIIAFSESSTERKTAIANMRPALRKRDASHAQPGGSWVQQYKVTSGGNLRMKRSNTTRIPGPKPQHILQAPDQEALDLRPADQWNTNSDLKNYPTPFSSNSEASRLMTSKRARRSTNDFTNEEAEKLQAGVREINSDASEKDKSPQAPLKRSADEEPFVEIKRAKTDEPEKPTWETGDRRTVAGGLFWYRGEILAHLLVNNHVVGPARLQGFDEVPWLFSAIVNSKPRESMRLELDFKDLISLDQFQERYRGVSWSPFTTAGAVSFESSERSISAFAAKIASMRVAAMLHLRSEDATLFAYSSTSTEWQFLRQNIPNRYPQAELLLVAARYMPPPTPKPVIPHATSPPMQLAGHPASQRAVTNDRRNSLEAVAPPPDPRVRPRRPSLNVTVTSLPPVEETVPELDQSKSPLNESTSAPPTTSVLSPTSPPPSHNLTIRPAQGLVSQISPQSPVYGSLSRVSDDSPIVSSSEDLEPKKMATSRGSESNIPKSPASDPFLALRNPDEIKQYFKSHYNITFDKLVPSDVPKSSISIFCLRFGRGNREEFNYWRRFLEACGIIPNHIYDTEKGGWAGWYNVFKALPKACGVIVTHESKSRDFIDLQSLAEVLHNSKTANIFATNLTTGIAGALTEHLSQLFPSGGAVLLTEATMVQDPDRAIRIIRWFVRQVQAKEGGPWKLYLRPRVSVWLMNIAKSLTGSDEIKGAKYIDMLMDIGRLFPPGKAPLYVEMPADLHNEADYNFDGTLTLDGDPIHIVSLASLDRYGTPSSRPEITQDIRDEYLLVEFFAGSAIRMATSFRKFYAITPIELKAWRPFSHIKFIAPAAFCTKMGIEGDGRASSGPPKIDSITEEGKSTSTSPIPPKR